MVVLYLHDQLGGYIYEPMTQQIKKNTWHNFKYDKISMVNFDIIYGQHLTNFRFKIFAYSD
jgi:hypothetical protein